jgi:hypothetical protein
VEEEVEEEEEEEEDEERLQVAEEFQQKQLRKTLNNYQ